ncbi:hypothetical protein PtB15_2B326 [Puccinia triticina]|nr:hypothetical protein PtB15_2B326 [Puccinia triticina]
MSNISIEFFVSYIVAIGHALFSDPDRLAKGRKDKERARGHPGPRPTSLVFCPLDAVGFRGPKARDAVKQLIISEPSSLFHRSSI